MESIKEQEDKDKKQDKNNKQQQQQHKASKKPGNGPNQLYPYAQSMKIPVYSPRTTYKKIREQDEKLLQELMLKLEPFTVQVIANDFENAGGEVRVAEFIILMKEHLKDWQEDIPNRDYKLIRTLANLFDQIDLNINELLDWEELANYVLGKATVIDNIKTRNQVVKYYSKIPNFTINHKFYNPIQKIIYIDHIDRLAFFQRGTDTIMIAGNDGVLNQKQLKVQPKDINIDVMNIKKDNNYNVTLEKKELSINRRTIIIDCLYISDYNLLMVSSNDGYIRGYRFVSNGFVPATFPKSEEYIEKEIQKTNISCMQWDGVKKLLYCGLNNGNIMVWCLGEKYEEQQLEINKKQVKKENTSQNMQKKSEFYLEKGHKLTVQDIIPMAKLQYVATGGLDGVIVLWDTITHTKKREYKEHQRGIVSLAFNPQTILLFSAGFDHWIGVWNPYTDHLIYKIDGHSCPILQIKVICKYKQLISLDQEGNVQIRDLNKFYINQTLQIEQPDEKNKFQAQDFCFTPNPLRLYFVGHSMQQYQYDIHYNPNLTDDKVPLTCLSIPKQLTLYTPCGNRVKVWSLLTGEIIRIFMGLTHQGTDISAFILDRLKKRMLIGDTEGYISILNAENGAKIKNLPRHNADVILIKECYEAKLFVTASINNQIHLTLDNDFGENELLRVITIKEQIISKITFFPDNKLVVVGTGQGQIAFFESESGKLHGISQSTKYNESITFLYIIPGIPFMISTTSTGKINFIAVPPLLYKYTIVDSFVNYDNEETKEPLGIVNAVYSPKENLLFLTDEKYMLKCYNIQEYIDNIKENVKEGVDMNKHELYSYYSTLKTFSGALKTDKQECIWCVKAHNEQINSLTYDSKHKLIITCSQDKKVKIWSSEKGTYLANLVQGLDMEKPKEIAHRKKFTQEIYGQEGELFENRIDINADKEKNNSLEESLNSMDKNSQNQDSEQNNQKKKQLNNINETIEDEEEFDNNAYYHDDDDEDDSSQIEEDMDHFQDEDEENDDHDNDDNEQQEEEIQEIIEGDENQQQSQNQSKSNQESNQTGYSQNNQKSKQSSDQQVRVKSQSKHQTYLTNMNQYKEQVENLSIEAEFDPFHYINKIDNNKMPGSLISNNEWKLFVDYKSIIDEQNNNLRQLEERIHEIQKKNKKIEFKERVFPITNFEVNPKLFDPNNQFRPYIQTKYEKDDSFNFADTGLSKQAIANQVKKQQQKEKGKHLLTQAHSYQRQKKVSEDTWNNLYRYKKNYRNIDPQKFKQKIGHSKKISDLTKQKVDLLLNKLEAYDQMTNTSNVQKKKAVKDNSTKKQSTQKSQVTSKQGTILSSQGSMNQSNAYSMISNDNIHSHEQSNQQTINTLINQAFNNKVDVKDFDYNHIYTTINQDNIHKDSSQY